MKNLCSSTLSRRTTWVAAFALIFTAACALVPRADAQTSDALFQYSTLTGSSNALTATQLPIQTSAGTSYVNVTINFSVDSSGNLTISGNPVIVPSPVEVVSNFLAGNYYGGGAQNGYGVTVSGPAETQGGNTEWSLSQTSNASGYTYPSNALWYVVSNIKNNPWYSRILKAKIDTQGWDAFGVVGSNNCAYGLCDPHWSTGSLLGFAQIGNQLTIVSFTTTTTTNGITTQTDSTNWVDEITYCQNVACGAAN
jgi:hypothetical protein